MKSIATLAFATVLLFQSLAFARSCTESEIKSATHVDFVEWFTHKYGFAKCVDVKLPINKKGEECDARIKIKLGGMSDVDEVNPPEYIIEECDKPSSSY
jgi:hypothetical protein